MMFAAITPLLITGGIAERMKFSAYLIFVCAWEFFVYAIFQDITNSQVLSCGTLDLGWRLVRTQCTFKQQLLLNSRVSFLNRAMELLILLEVSLSIPQPACLLS
jgi:hypothetical protein